jgi:hypothetical protein
MGRIIFLAVLFCLAGCSINEQTWQCQASNIKNPEEEPGSFFGEKIKYETKKTITLVRDGFLADFTNPTFVLVDDVKFKVHLNGKKQTVSVDNYVLSVWDPENFHLKMNLKSGQFSYSRHDGFLVRKEIQGTCQKIE